MNKNRNTLTTGFIRSKLMFISFSVYPAVHCTLYTKLVSSSLPNGCTPTFRLGFNSLFELSALHLVRFTAHFQQDRSNRGTKPPSLIYYYLTCGVIRIGTWFYFVVLSIVDICHVGAQRESVSQPCSNCFRDSNCLPH